MKSGVQLNFLERRARADRALSQLVRMVHDATEALSSREQRGVYRLETPLEKRSATLPEVDVGMGSRFVARWCALWMTMLALVRALRATVGAYAQRAFARARIAWDSDLPRILLAVRVGFVRGGARLRQLRVRKSAVPEPHLRHRVRYPRRYN